MTWEIVVGIETHTQLLTRSKMFSGAPNAFGAEPNRHACAVDIALPGTLPVANRAAIEHAVRFGLAVKGNISPRSIFARKNYFYPDLPKGYQISQYEIPVVQGGTLAIVTPEGEKVIHLTRAHLEEDAGKSLHEGFRGMSGIDLNRAGTPLLEIVTEPELRGAKEAVIYARTLHSLVRWIGICDGNMQEGSFRCDANVSVRKAGDTKLGTRCEIKNLNSFLFMEQAIVYEANRQIDMLESGGKIDQETRLFDAEIGETRAMRSKEDAQDYRYFPDPDLLPLIISQKEIDQIKIEMPEGPESVRRRFIDEYHFPLEMAFVLTLDRVRAEHFDTFWKHLLVLTANVDSMARVQAANFAMMEIGAAMGRLGISVEEILPDKLALLIARVLDNTISHRIAKDVFAAMLAGEGTPDEIIAKRGLEQISDSGAIEKIVDQVLAANAKQVEDYRAGKDKAFNSLVGQVMKRTQGKANPAQVNEILRRRLGR
jgi:aspartyl-tRNA(Asn)/glutamyl-tRNA(Gln) amidotransferase subunit B